MKVVLSSWLRKLKEEIIKALLRIKVEGPEIEQFIKEHSSDVASFWWDAKKEIRREGEMEKIQEMLQKALAQVQKEIH